MPYTQNLKPYLKSYSASITVLSNNTAIGTTLAAVYTKIKSTVLTNCVYPSGSLRITFDLRQTVSGTAFAKIYRNGVAIGTERSSVSNTWTTQATQDFSFTNLKSGDTFEIWAYNNGGGSSDVQNVQIMAAINDFGVIL